MPGLKHIKIGSLVIFIMKCVKKTCLNHVIYSTDKLGINSAVCGPLHRNLATVTVLNSPKQLSNQYILLFIKS